MYYSNYMIIKYIGFEHIIYAINLDAASFSRVFNEFDYQISHFSLNSGILRGE